MLFSPTRDEARRFLIAAWTKFRSGQRLTALEQMAADLIALHLPSKHFLVKSWQETGEIPRWCPYNFAGMPFVHDIQVSAFYPPNPTNVPPLLTKPTGRYRLQAALVMGISGT